MTIKTISPFKRIVSIAQVHQISKCIYWLKLLKLSGKKSFHQKKIIPIKWIQNLSSEQFAVLLNHGAHGHKSVYKIFYPPNISEEPDFRLNVKDICDNDRPACCMAKILNGFGNFGMIHW